jgi:chromosomal replication initiation ATPase DnaA
MAVLMKECRSEQITFTTETTTFVLSLVMKNITKRMGAYNLPPVLLVEKFRHFQR